METIAQFIALNCPGCGANLEIAPGMEVFACAYCGRQQMVRRCGGIVSLGLLAGAVERVQQGTDRIAAELAIRRLREELSQLEAAHRRVSQTLAKGTQLAIFLLVTTAIFGSCAILFGSFHEWWLAGGMGFMLALCVIQWSRFWRGRRALAKRWAEEYAPQIAGVREQLQSYCALVAS